MLLFVTVFQNEDSRECVALRLPLQRIVAALQLTRAQRSFLHAVLHNNNSSAQVDR